MHMSILERAVYIAVVSVLVLSLLLFISWSLGYFNIYTLNSEEIRFSVALSLISASIATILSMLIAIPMAHYIVLRNKRVDSLALALITLPNALSPAAVGLIALIFFTQTPLGVFINRNIAVVNDPKGIVIVQFLIALPMSLGLSMAILRTLSPSYEDVALTLGYKRSETLFRLIIPMLRDSFILSGILVFTRVLGEFGASYMIGGAIRYRTETLPIALYYVNSYGDLAALSTLLTLYISLVLALMILLYLSFKRDFV